jgi:hypothetical protein
MRALFAIGLAVLLGACVDTGDDPSTVKDLRVLGVRTDPPEIMTDHCDVGALVSAANDGGITDTSIFNLIDDVTFTTLIADPKGMGRMIDWELIACPGADDVNCSQEPQHTKVLAKGQTTDGELAVTVKPGAVLFPDGPLLLFTVREDQYHGVGGIRQPVVVHLKAGDEEIFAQKLMVFSCKFFPAMKANVNPVLPGIKVQGTEWTEDETVVLSGQEKITVTVDDFTSLQEDYVVPSFELKPLQLTEAWLVSFYGEEGRFSEPQLGGVGFDGQVQRQRNEWQAYTKDTEMDLRFWFVVRDGRGGLTWLKRKAHFKP